MTKYLAGVLSVIAAGVLLIAYGLLNPRAALDPRADLNQFARPMLAGERVMLGDSPYANAAAPAYGYSSSAAPRFVTAPTTEVRRVRTVSTAEVAPSRVTTRTVERSTGRNWKKTALVIGGSSAAGAGIGAIFGGKKGALIGAAIGGGASTIYETRR
jgi:hypothetical protein